MKVVERANLFKLLLILSPILAAVLAVNKIPIDTGSDNFLVPFGVFIGIPFIAIFGAVIGAITRNSLRNKTYSLTAYAAAAIFVCIQMLFGIMLV